jgi:hypothetical protein
MKYKTGHFTCYEKRTFALANNTASLVHASFVQYKMSLKGGVDSNTR